MGTLGLLEDKARLGRLELYSERYAKTSIGKGVHCFQLFVFLEQQECQALGFGNWELYLSPSQTERKHSEGRFGSLHETKSLIIGRGMTPKKCLQNIRSSIFLLSVLIKRRFA